MLPKLLLAAVIGVLLLTNTTSTSANSITSTSAAASATTTTTTTTAAVSSKILHAAAATTTTSLLPLQPPPINVTSTTTSSLVPAQTEPSISDNVTVTSDSLPSGSTTEKRNEFQNTGKTEGSYRVQLPNGAAQTQVEYKADSTGYYPVVRYESNTNGSSVSGHFALGQSSVSELPLSGKAPQLPVNSEGYIQFELNYDDAAARVPADQQRSAPRTEKVGQVLTKLFPNGFSDIFRFSYASEESNTAGHSNTTATPAPTAAAAATTSNAAKTAENQTYYSYATTVSKEYRRAIKPGHTEIVVEQMNKAPHTSSEEFKDGSNGITKDELLRINRAAVDASVLPSLLMEPTKLNATKAQLAAAANAPIVILNEDSVELEQTDGEDNQIAESQYVAQHVYQRLPDYEEEGLRKANSDLSALEQQINVQIIHDDTLKALQNEALAKQLFTPAAELPPEQSAAFPAEAATVSYELDRFQEHAEQNFQQRNLLQEAPSRKFLKNFNPKLSEGDGEPVLKGNFHYESSTPRPLVDPPTPISEAQHGGYAGEYVKPAAQLEYQRSLEQQQKEEQRQQQLKQQQQQQQQYLQQKQYLTQQHEQQQQKQQQQQFVHSQPNYQQQSQSQFSHQQQHHPQPQPQPPQAHATSSLNTHIHDSNPLLDYDGYKSTAAPAQASSGSNNLVFVTVSTPAAKTSPSPSAPTTKIGKTPHEFVSEAAAASQTISKKVPRPNLGYTFVEVQKSVNIHNKLIKEQDGKVLEQHETTYHQPQYAALQEQQPKQQNQQQQQEKEQQQQQGGQQHYQFQQHQAQHEYQYQKPTQQYQQHQGQHGYQYQQQQTQQQQTHQQQQQGYQYQTPPQQYQISYQQHYQPQQQYQQTDYQQQKYEPTYEKQPVKLSAKDFVSLAANPIHVQHLDYESEQQQEAASHNSAQHVPLPQVQLQPPAPDAATELQAAGSKRQEHLHAKHAEHEEQQQPTVQYIQKYVPQPYPVQVEKIVERPYPVTQVFEQKEPAPYPVREIVEKIVDRPVTVEKVVDRPVKVPYPVHVDRYIDRPYPVHEIVEKHIGIPYAVPEPVPVAVPVDHFIDRPYPVETIVEKRVPYPVEKIVEKVVEKHVPVEVERIVEKIVEKPVERLVHRYVDRPVPMPIHVPVAVPMSFQHAQAYGPEPLYPPTTQGGHHPNALSWSQAAAYQIPAKVLQNYYARMLKKMLPQVGGHKTFALGITQAHAVSKAPVLPTPAPPPAHKAGDIRFDLKPPPPLNSNWAKGARYIYNTLPQDLSASASVALAYQLPLNNGQAPPSTARESNDAFERWRHGHSLKRSPDFGRNLHMEYGFKPPLVPSVEIDDHGMPLAKSQTGE